MISIETVQKVHSILIKNFGGADGIRDLGALESALSRPFQFFEDTPLYPDMFQKAAALLESIVGNHPFVDGNKRTGYVLTRLFLIANNYDILATEEEKYLLVIAVASGKKHHEEIVEWLKAHCIQKNAR